MAVERGVESDAEEPPASASSPKAAPASPARARALSRANSGSDQSGCEASGSAAGTKRSSETPESPSHVKDVKRSCVAAVFLDEPVDYSALDTFDGGDIVVPTGISLEDTRS